MRYYNTVFVGGKITAGWANVYNDTEDYVVGAVWDERMDADPEDRLIYRIRIIPKTTQEQA